MNKYEHVYGVRVLWKKRLYVGLSCVFFFQAEDGIRDLVRSRGLGDVYKRQQHNRQNVFFGRREFNKRGIMTNHAKKTDTAVSVPVSYTHLTLPTSDLV